MKPIMIKPLYGKIEDPSKEAMTMGQNAVSYGGKLDRSQGDPGPTAGGAVGAMLGGAATGGSIVPGIGSAVGGFLGLAGYLLQ